MCLEVTLDRKNGREEGRDYLWFPGRGFLEQLIPPHKAQSTPMEKSERFQQVQAGLVIIASSSVCRRPPICTSWWACPEHSPSLKEISYFLYTSISLSHSLRLHTCTGSVLRLDFRTKSGKCWPLRAQWPCL